MQLQTVVPARLSEAVVAAGILTLVNSYTGEIAGALQLLTEFLLYTGAIFAGFVGIDALWNRVFDT